MSRADNSAALSDVASVERCAHVRADVVHGIDLTLVMKHEDGASMHFHHTTLADR
jgi:hypothetical protein